MFVWYGKMLIVEFDFERLTYTHAGMGGAAYFGMLTLCYLARLWPQQKPLKWYCRSALTFHTFSASPKTCGGRDDLPEDEQVSWIVLERRVILLQ